MSTYNLKALALENRDASPPVLTNPELSQGLPKMAVGVQRTAAAVIDAGSTIKLMSIPSNARVDNLEYCRDTLGTSTLDIAVWYPTSIPQGGENAPAASLEGTLISSSVFVSGLAGTDAALGWTDGMGAGVTPSVDQRGKRLFEVLGLANDPGIELDVGFSVRVATAEQGYVGMRAQYVD
jgi:hypothetical protein